MNEREMSRIRILQSSREIPEGGCPQPLDDISFPEHKTHPVVVSMDGQNDKVCELPAQLSVAELSDIVGKETDHIKAIYLGWPTGQFVGINSPEMILKTDCETIYLIQKKECMVDMLAKLTENMRNSCCGRCVFGREGTYQLHLFFLDIIRKKGKKSDIDQIMELCELMSTQSMCSLGKAAASSVMSAINGFYQDFEEHIVQKRCTSLVCREYINYYIDPNLCTGCRKCADACEEEAIKGRKNFIHILDTDMCEKCRVCIEVCPNGAIQPVSGKLPPLPRKPVPCGSWK